MATSVDESNRDHAAITRQDAEPANGKDCATGAKVKRKSRSTRRRLNAAMSVGSQASLHSDTDSEGELTTITSKIGRLNPAALQPDSQRNPLISVTVSAAENGEEDPEASFDNQDNLDYLITDGKARSHSRCSSVAEVLTDVEIYSESEKDKDDENKDSASLLKVVDDDRQPETDLEDLEIEDDEDIQETIYLTPRSDILMNGETITTKEGDGPFSEEVRNRLLRAEVSVNREGVGYTSDMPDTDSENMEVSEDEAKLDEAVQCHVYDEFQLLTSSQIVVTSKEMENTLHVPDTAEEAISDCHTDIEDVD